MAILHVAVTGRDRRHLSELRNKFGWSSSGPRPAAASLWMPTSRPTESTGSAEGYGVELLEEIEAPGRARQAEGRAAAETRLKSTAT